ncbi:NAD(P)/FAD-dependent oxidoreductase [Sinomonas flava]|uniref:NAD(P)/FAD-dependent oxidoreductase n=1 Tax=Sinomonas flava TaxID=496857 RepID=A0ABP5NRX7_9MICC
MSTVVVVGAGQAGLAVSHELGQRGIEHTVLERSRIGQAWRDRWDSFTLVTPHWSLGLPGNPYEGDDPEGFVPRHEVVGYLEGYAAAQAAPVREGVEVTRLARTEGRRLRLDTTEGPLEADAAVVCTGSFRRQHRPQALAGIPDDRVTRSADYRSPDQLPDGPVLVVGGGQSGCQIAEELRLAGRDVTLACGRAPWIPRRLDGVDTVTWLARTSFYDLPLSALPTPAARLLSNPLVSGARGGHDLNWRTLAALGVQLAGHVAAVDDGVVAFADDLADSVAFGDARWADLRDVLAAQLPARGYPVPELPVPAPFAAEPVAPIPLGELGAVVLASGFRPDYSWIEAPACDALGFPLTDDGESTEVPGLYFCGVHFMRTRASAVLFGVGRDAAVVAGRVARGLAEAARL